ACWRRPTCSPRARRSTSCSRCVWTWATTHRSTPEVGPDGREPNRSPPQTATRIPETGDKKEIDDEQGARGLDLRGLRACADRLPEGDVRGHPLGNGRGP